MKYAELKDFLGKHPYCFKPIKEKQAEFDRKVADSEGKPIIFVQMNKK